MISVILPTFNGDQYLEQSILSVLGQTYTDFELIIVDDCSTDLTNNIASKYVKYDSRVHLIRNSQNLRLPQSLNVGFQASQGSYLTWTSDDNLYDKKAFEIMVSALEKHDNIDFVFANMQFINSDSQVLYTFNQKVKEADDLWYDNCIGACFLYKRDVYETIGDYDSSLFLVEDYDYWIRVAKKYQMLYIKEPLYQYRVHENSLSQKRKRDVAQKRNELLEKEINDSNLSLDVKNKILVQLINNNYYLGDRASLITLAKELKKSSPAEYKHIGRSARLNVYLNKGVIEKIKKIMHD